MDEFQYALGTLEDFHRNLRKYEDRYFLHVAVTAMGIVGACISIGFFLQAGDFSRAWAWFVLPGWILLASLAAMSGSVIKDELRHYRYAVDKLSGLLYKELKDQQENFGPLASEVFRIRLDRISQSGK